VEKTPPLPSISCNGSGIGFSAFAVALVSAEMADGLSAATGGGVGDVEEADEVGDERPAGSAAVVVQASAEATASEAIRV
jgi:hypothetical protein